MRRKFTIIFILLLSLTLACPLGASAATKGGILQYILRYGDDVAKFGKQAAKVTKSQMDDIIKRFPALAGKSADLVKGAVAIEKVTQKSPAAGKLIEGGINPTRVVIAAERAPDQLKLADGIATLLAATKPVANAAGIPAKAVQVARTLDGNFAKAGNAFFEMTRRGGQTAVKVARQLYELATPGRITAAAATALLAWHMVDPDGAEEAVKEFLQEHVGGIGKAIIEGAGGAVDKTLDAVTDEGAKVASNHGGLLVGIALVIILVVFFGLSRRMRQVPGALMDSLAGKLLGRIQSPRHSRNPGRSNEDEHFNIYNRRG